MKPSFAYVNTFLEVPREEAIFEHVIDVIRFKQQNENQITDQENGRPNYSSA